ncbi:MAG: Crp/Fnr family transcriptional regulator [Cytophagales bacterium]|nr:Crp/Fnr family transcriptional regulator [Cytophagales bacterium]
MEHDVPTLLSPFFEKPLVDELEAVASIRPINEGDVLIEYDDTIRFIPILLQGLVKVTRVGEEGKELLLYYLKESETCSMTMNCCMGHKKSQVRAVVEEDGLLLRIPIQYMEEWMRKYASWRQMVLLSFQSRFDEILLSLDQIAFKKMDERLLHYLEEKTQRLQTRVLKITHQLIADDLNTSREVISRLLKQMEREGLIKLGRNEVRML